MVHFIFNHINLSFKIDLISFIDQPKKKNVPKCAHVYQGLMNVGEANDLGGF